MNANDIVLDFIHAFDELAIPYMVVGSYSSNLYGRPRSTKDADFVIQCPDAAMAALRAKLGKKYTFDPQMSFESVTGTMREIITHPSTAFTVELFHLSDEAHDQSRFARRIQRDFDGERAWLPTPEDVVITKLRWSKQGQRAKDLDDVREVLAVQKQLDLPYIRHWCDHFKSRDLFERILVESVL